MFSCRSLLFNAACILGLSGITLADIFENDFGLHTVTCLKPQSFTVELSNYEKAHLYEVELAVHFFTNQFSTIWNPRTKTTYIDADDVDITFRGMLVIEDAERQVRTQPERIYVIYRDRISGVAERITKDSTDDDKAYYCRLALLPSEPENTYNLEQLQGKPRIMNGIRRFGESCLEIEFCDKIHHTEPPEILPTPMSLLQSEPDLLPVDPDSHILAARPGGYDGYGNTAIYFNQPGVQSVMNKFVDVALIEIMNNGKYVNQGSIDVSMIDEEFTIGPGIFETVAHLKTTNGTLYNLANIRRTTNVILAQIGMKIVAFCGFGLKDLHLTYDRYSLQYGLFNLNGELSADIAEMSLEATLIIDYTEKPCRMQLQHVKVKEMSEIAIAMTSIIGTSGIVSYVANWVAQKFKEDIVIAVEGKMRQKINTMLVTFDCERLRP